MENPLEKIKRGVNELHKSTLELYTDQLAYEIESLLSDDLTFVEVCRIDNTTFFVNGHAIGVSVTPDAVTGVFIRFYAGTSRHSVSGREIVDAARYIVNTYRERK